MDRPKQVTDAALGLFFTRPNARGFFDDGPRPAC